MEIGRIEPRWTLGRLMLLVALVAVPLAWYVHRVREIARERDAADATRDLAVVRSVRLLKLLDDRAKLDKPRLDATGGPTARPSETPR